MPGRRATRVAAAIVLVLAGTSVFAHESNVVLVNRFLLRNNETDFCFTSEETLLKRAECLAPLVAK